MNGYSEKLSPAWWLILAIGLLVPASLLIFLPLDIMVGLGVGVTLWVGSVGILWVFAPRIAVDSSGVSAGNARIEHQYVSNIEVFTKERARIQRGPQLDARAWLVISPWVDPVMKITITDPLDPTPYWLVSCKHPEKFVSSWDALRKTT